MINITNDQPWAGQALCAQSDVDAWYPDKGADNWQVKLICQGCPARLPCLQYALDNDERYGVWGGYSERERRRLKKGEVFRPVIRHRAKRLKGEDL